MIKDIAFKSEKELTAKYGKPKKTAKSPEQDALGLGDYNLEWSMPNKQRIVVFYGDANFKKPEGISIYNYQFKKESFYKEFGWDKPIIKQEKGILKAIGLSGFYISYSENDKILILYLDNPELKSFGKLK